MAGSVLVDAGFLIALLSRRDRYHSWAAAESARLAGPWKTCEAVLSEAFHLLGARGAPALAGLLRRGAVAPVFALNEELERVLKLMEKYGDIPMSLADGCLVRMSETFPDPIVVSTDADFQIYRRHGRQIVPCRTPF
jgi:predicted nucleic acid-binding protein